MRIPPRRPPSNRAPEAEKANRIGEQFAGGMEETKTMAPAESAPVPVMSTGSQAAGTAAARTRSGKRGAAHDTAAVRQLGGPYGASFTGEGTRGLSWPRRHTTPGVHPYDEIEWELRTASISNESGKSVFEQKDVEVPRFWSQLATNVVVSKYFRGHVGTPERERSVKQLIDRVVNTIAAWAETQHYFATDEDLTAFKAELTHLLVHQKMAFNSPVWFNVGVEPRPQCSACQPYRALVSTPDGMVPIGQLVDEGALGREVYDANGVTRIVAVKRNGRKPVRRIRLRNGSFIEATPDHVVKAARQRRSVAEWLPVEELAVGMRMHLHPHRAKVAARALVPAGVDALVGELSAFEPVEGQAAILAAEAALAGWLQADGFVGQYEHGTNRSLTIEFQVANDDEYRWVMENLDVALPHVHVKVRDADTKETRVQRIRVYGEVVREFVERWDLLERGTEIRVPSRLWTASYDEIGAYLRSIFQADGYVSVRRDNATGWNSARIGFAVIGERWTEDVQLLLNVLGIYSRRTRKHDPRSNRHDLHEVAISVGSERARFAELVGFVSREKQARLRQSLSLAGLKTVPHVREEEIVAIEELGVEEVYDIQTESGEYLSNNVAVHNCFINSVQDNMGSIMDLAKTEAMLFKFGSGAGSNLSPIRSAREKMTGGGTASGPVSFMKGYDAFAGVVKCLTGDTYVTTGGGLLRIDEAIETEGPVGFEESDALTLNTPAGPTRISHIYRSPLAPIRAARLRTGLELTGTHEHPVLTLTSGFELQWKKLADLRAGDRVAVERRRELWPSHAPRLDAFSTDLVVERRKLRYPTEMTPELARLLGYLVAEGSVEGERFRFSSADPEVMADYCRCVDAVFGVDPSSQVRSRVHPTTGVVTEFVELSWKGALQFFEYCGLPASLSAQKNVPISIRRSPRSLVLEFLGAYTEGDGHVGGTRLEYTTASRRLAQEVQLLALNLGVVGRRSTVNGYEHVNFLGADGAQLARLLHPYLVTPRKRAAAADAVESQHARTTNPNLDVIPGLVPALRALSLGGGWFQSAEGSLVRTGFGIFNRTSDNVSYGRASAVPGLLDKVGRLSPTLAGTLESVLDDQYLWDEVVSVSDAGRALTYDFTVPEVHAFVSNGIVSHNSGGKTRRAAKMVILDVDHPDVLDFIDSKMLEEKKAWALIEQGYDPSFTGEAYGSVFFQNANHSVRVTDEFMNAVVNDGEWTTHAVVDGAPMGTYRARDIFRRMADAAHLCGDPGIQYDTTINDWNPVSNSDRQYATNPCVTGDTLVATDEGWRSIESLVGERVNVIGADGQPHPVDRVFPTGTKPVFELRTTSGYRVRITADHKVATTRGDVAVKDLQPDDRIFLNAPGFGREQVAPALAEAIGLAVGDGCLVWTAAGEIQRPMLVLTMHANEAGVLEAVAVELNAQKRALKAVGSVGRNDGVHVSMGATGSRLAFASRPVVEQFMGYAVLDEGSALKRFKPAVHGLDRASMAALLRGLFTADGTVVDSGSRSQYVGLDSTSLELLEQVQRLLLGFGIKSKLYEKRRAGKVEAILPDGLGGHKAYPVREMHSLRITRSSRVRFEREIGFMAGSPKATKLARLNARVSTYSDELIDGVGSITPLGEEPVFDLTEGVTSHFVANGLVVHNCSEFSFLNDTSCNLASVNLMTFVGADGEFNVEDYRYACCVTITAQEILVDNAGYPTPKIEENSHRFRPLGLGYANLGALLMSRGLAYDSDEGRNFAAALTSIMTAEAYRQSAVIARDHGGPFVEYKKNEAPFLRVMEMHRDAAYEIPAEGVPAEVLEQARRVSDEALELGREHGYRNAQISLLAPTGCLVGDSLVMTDRGLVRLKGLGNPDGEKWQELDLHVATDDGPRPATKFFVNDAEPVVSVETTRGYRIQGTTTHRIRIVDANGDWQWRRFADLRAGDRVPLMLGGMIGEPREVPLPPLPEAYWTSDHRTFVPRAMTADLAELVGYFMGDGSLHSRGLRFSVTAGDDDVVERIVELGRRLFGLDAAVAAKTGYTEVALHSVRLALWWEACGFAKHAPNDAHRGQGSEAHVPDAVLYANDPAAYRAFVRGLFEADGNVNNGYASFSTVSERFSREIQTLLLALGFPTTRKTDAVMPGRKGTNPIHVLRVLNASSGARFLVEISLISERKREALAQTDHPQAARYDLVPVSRETVDRLAPDNDHLRRTMLLSLARTGLVSRRSATALLERSADPELAQDLGYFYDEIASAKLGEEQLTYDISVPSNVTYVANGFVSHNTIAFMMDCDTTGVEPDIALIKYKKLVGEGFLKIVNQTVPAALRKLGYGPDQVEGILAYLTEHETIEGAPGLKPEHLPVFDCAFKPQNGVRSIHYMGHVRMMGAIQPFLSGAISKTVNMPEAATAEEIEQVYLEGWKRGLKAIAIYRDNSKRSQPLSTGKKKDGDVAVAEADAAIIEGLKKQLAAAQAEAVKPHRRRLPAERQAVTHKFDIAGHEGYITVGLYPDGQPGEIFLKMAKEGSTVSGLMDTFATTVSVALQYGVPLKDLVNKFAHVRFEPSGFTGNQEIPIAKSIVDYIFRWLGSRFLSVEDKANLGLIDRSAIVDAPPASGSGSSTGLLAGGGPAPREVLATGTPPPSAAAGSPTQRPQSMFPASEDSTDEAPPRATAVATSPAEEKGKGAELAVVASNGHAANGNGKAGNGSGGVTLALGNVKVAFAMQGDAPSCMDCGSIMVRNGSCYKCLNCGSTSGCS